MNPINTGYYGYYLGETVEFLEDYGDGWCSARFVTDRKQRVWRMWRAQLKTEPWGEVNI